MSGAVHTMHRSCEILTYIIPFFLLGLLYSRGGAFLGSSNGGQELKNRRVEVFFFYFLGVTSS